MFETIFTAPPAPIKNDQKDKNAIKTGIMDRNTWKHMHSQSKCKYTKKSQQRKLVIYKC